ncbi:MULTISPECIES: hypothetical protein [Corynebacterium]|uniref:Uncharacterized protein n=1 Tax=Corynebacterium pseudogenitalium TaxID=38303 RepID=A0ABD4TSM4_9CORY|nr:MULTISPECIES: hypothetical protein [Corynebacterium]MCQ4611973.1 hypothetical protein [Corynebacterium sp. CCUG 51687]MCQ4613781.1 hypothetical protein [Corynebacterium pseudogenitalium]
MSEPLEKMRNRRPASARPLAFVKVDPDRSDSGDDFQWIVDLAKGSAEKENTW